MKYTMLLWPHANARYQQEATRLARAELRLMLDRVAPEAEAGVNEGAAMPSLWIDCPGGLSERAVAAIGAHSLLYGLFERREDGSLMPVAGRAPALLGGDLPAILKYKGKTNELFLQLLINVALYSGDYWDEPGGLRFLDPMCGRATAPFIALNRGWEAVGADVDSNDLKEAEKYFKRYLEYHRFKHTLTRESRTLRGGRPVPVARFTVGDTPERFKAGQTVSLSLANLDAARAGQAFNHSSFHIIACDLPYGVRHDPQSGGDAIRGKRGLETLLENALAGWHDLLKIGGSLALSFNAQTTRRDRLFDMLADAGFETHSGGPYDEMAHWVEQAITRDVAVARKFR